MWRGARVLLEKRPPLGTWSMWGPSHRLRHDNTDRTTNAAPHDLFSRSRQHQQKVAAAASAAAGVRGSGSSASTTATNNNNNNNNSAAPSGLFRSGKKSKSGTDPLHAKVAATGGPVHLYANKENAWEGYTDDRYYGAKRFREYWRRMLVDRGMRYYIATTLVIMLLAGGKLYSLQQDQQRQYGLIGPKKKQFRSRLTVVLDVDETLVSYGDKAFRMQAGLVARPHLAELLDYLTDIDAEVVLWSACSERYMKQVLSVIDPLGVRVSQYITRQKDWFTSDHYYEKNIAWLKRNFNDVLIVENRALSVRNCNANAILVEDFIRGEYMDTGQDYPPNDHALLTVRHIIADLERTGRPVPEYLADAKGRDAELHEVPCHLVIRQLPEELARGVFYFVGKKYTSAETKKKSLWMRMIDPMTNRVAISKDAKAL